MAATGTRPDVSDGIVARVRNYYDGRLAAHGTTPAGVDWNSRESQELRFRQLAQLWRDDPDASVVDYGCGYGALAAWMRADGQRGDYAGYDVSAAMIAAALRAHSVLERCRFTNDRAALAAGDFAVASGIFNVKLDTSDAEWREHVLHTIDDLATLGTRGFGFNVLTIYSDAERRRPDLHYADPLELFEHCRRTYSRRVALLHDYPLYEFTILVRM